MKFLIVSKVPPLRLPGTQPANIVASNAGRLRSLAPASMRRHARSEYAGGQRSGNAAKRLDAASLNFTNDRQYVSGIMVCLTGHSMSSIF
jgi:hypothetical protein